jgi:hypothetical protein
MSMKSYRVLVKWRHRKWGPQTMETAAEGTSIRRAIAHALLSFFSDSNSREKRRDAHAQLVVSAWRIPKKAAK